MLLLFVISCPFEVYSQQNRSFDIEIIDSLVLINDFIKADSVLNFQIAKLKHAKLYDSLYHYPLYVGKVAALKHNSILAANRAQRFVDKLAVLTSDSRTMFRAYLNMEELYIQLGNDTKALEVSKKALEYAKSVKDIEQKELGQINYNIGFNYYALYDLSNASVYFKQSTIAYEKSKNAKKSLLSDAYNGVAIAMWTLNKLDSAQIYFNKAIKTAEISELEGFDRLYYVNAFKFNLALVLDDSGNVNEAIEMKKEIIKNFQKIIASSKDDELVNKSKRLMASSFSNLAALYNDIGFTTKAYDMLKYAYEKKKLVYESTSPRLITTIDQLATAEITLRDFDKSIETVNKGLKKLKTLPNAYPSVEAGLLRVKARAYEEKGDIVRASKLYEESEVLYNKAYPNEYGRDYLVLLRDYAFFLATNGQKEKALDIAKKSYNYILKNGGNDNFPLLKEIASLSNVYFEVEDFKMAHEWAKKGNTYLDDKIKKASSSMDSIQIEYRRPNIILLEAKSEYLLVDEKNEKFLLRLAEKLHRSITILEKRKSTIFNSEDINLLLSESKSITKFSKQVYLDLYELTKSQNYLDKILELHEANVYNKIRTRLNLRYNVNFANIPPRIFKREQELKKAFSHNLSEKDAQINTFFIAEKNWKSFLDSLKTNYPNYYQMRYAEIKADLDDLQSKLPINTTVIRYLHIDGNLFAFVISENEKSLTKLTSKDLSTLINTVKNNSFEPIEVSSKLHQLYAMLWQPFEDKISTHKVIIIPDRELFNLSFETLLSKTTSSFKELVENSLISKYTISYNYSVLLLDKHRKTIDYSNDFIAFAPEFNDKMKESYRIAIFDSLKLDKSYLKLLPQPFAVGSAKEYSRFFNGSSFLNEKASKQIFTEQAKEHKIIHIGTHAESNNLSPELSRLIFAKNVNDTISSEDNSLYTYEIYNQNLSSNLAILTACETGKPTFQPGEGMISLAHAFNYAGSESILTSLWKIDEQSSVAIIENFYRYLKEGFSKDEALKKAKLDYIATAEGRTISPQYWAGLVLIGDTAPINLKTSSNFVLWLLGIILIILIIVTLRKIKK